MMEAAVVLAEDEGNEIVQLLCMVNDALAAEHSEENELDQF